MDGENVLERRSLRAGPSILRENDPGAVGVRIRERREALGLMQHELAEQVGVSLRAVGAWEAGDFAPTGQNLLALAKVLGKSTMWIREGDTDETMELAELRKLVETLTQRVIALEERLSNG